MKTGRNILISAFVALGAAGAIAPAVAAAAPAVVASAPTAVPNTWYHT
jgi:hypothetical protein